MFNDFHGNSDVVRRLREMLARDHFPQAVILAGPAGSGKYTLALMLARAMNCLSPTTTDGLPDFCGACSNCIRIAQSQDLDARFAEAVEARENLRETDKKETRLFVQTHPDVLVIPPDPPQMMIKVDQVRRVIGTIYYRPGEARERVYIFTESSFMKEAANSLLKVLEEPPEFATIFLLTENAGELLPTIRSRSMIVTLASLSTDEIEQDLARHRQDWTPKQRALAARLSNGAVGAARSFDLAGYTAARTQALTILNTALRGADHSELFKVTETYRAGAEGRDKTEKLLRTIYSLLQDLVFLNSDTPELVRNTDIQAELKRLSEGADFDWITLAADQLNEVERGMRRNLLRSLSLDAFATALERTSG
ncbi:MAG TPA: DNA polymerase III subunit delta' [Terriglobales bacterium]|nr:DNA polymerase III subunit delta' [Terriglobales bacterium]